MRTYALALFALVAIITGTIIVSCGEVDPALAPAGASISIMGSNQTEWTYSCHEDSNLPIVCYDTWRNYLIEYCRLVLTEDPDQAVQECLAGGSTLGDCTLLVCDTQNYWLTFAENRQVLLEAQTNISITVGACGYLNTIISAFVTKPDVSEGAGGQSGITEGSEGSGGYIRGIPMNDIEVRFIAEGGELYKLSDIPSDIPPLANPYVTRTDDRGKAEVKYRTPLPTLCDYTQSYILSADIGVSISFYQLDFTVEAGEEEEGADDDDDTTTE